MRAVPPRRPPGFTLMELLVVIAIIAIIAILATLLLPALSQARAKGQPISRPANPSAGQNDRDLGRLFQAVPESQPIFYSQKSNPQPQAKNDSTP